MKNNHDRGLFDVAIIPTMRVWTDPNVRIPSHCRLSVNRQPTTDVSRRKLSLIRRIGHSQFRWEELARSRAHPYLLDVAGSCGTTEASIRFRRYFTLDYHTSCHYTNDVRQLNGQRRIAPARSSTSKCDP